MSKKNILRVAATVVVVTWLAACSSSDNLRDPVDSVGSSTGCDPSTDQTCVQAQFAGDVVANLDYECGKIRAVTDAEGFFTCQADSTATFFIGFPDSDKRVILGSTIIKPKKVPSSFASLTGGRVVEVSVANLASVGGDASGNKQVLNILRFLLALDEDAGTQLNASADAAVAGFRASNHIVITDAVRAKVVALEESIPATEFAVPAEGSDEELRQSLKDFLLSAGRNPAPGVSNLPTLAKTQAYYRSFLQARNSGFFISTATPCSSEEDGSVTFYDLGMCRIRKDTTAFRQGADMNMMVDRTGYVFGFGMSYEALSDSTSAEPITDAVPFYLKGVADAPFAGRAFDYVSSKLSILGDEPTPRYTYAWTGVVRDDAIASTKDNYKNIYGEDIVAGDPRLGLWQQKQSGQTKNGQFLLFNIKAANPYLKEEFYGPSKPSYPKAIELDFRYNASTCTKQSTDTRPAGEAEGEAYDKAFYCASRGKVAISLMPSGNIVTNRHSSCAKITDDATTATLTNAENESEWRLGYISSASAAALSFTVLFPATEAGTLDLLKGVMLGVDRNNLALMPTTGDEAFTWTETTGPVWVDFIKTRESIGSSETAPRDSVGIVTARAISTGCS